MLFGRNKPTAKSEQIWFYALEDLSEINLSSKCCQMLFIVDYRNYRLILSKK